MGGFAAVPINKWHESEVLYRKLPELYKTIKDLKKRIIDLEQKK